MKLVKKEPVLPQERWDLSVKNHHNFVANKVVVHNSNIRFGQIIAPNDTVESNNGNAGRAEFQLMCGSHDVRRKEFDAKGKRSKYWEALTPEIINLLTEIADVENNVVVFGEIFGAGIQDMTYGCHDQRVRAFDIAVNGKYLDYDEQERLFNEFGVEMVPVLYRGPFSVEKVRELTDGPTTMCEPEKAGKFAGREGVVIRPVKERYSSDLPNYGRVIFKSVSVDYLSRKGGTEYH